MNNTKELKTILIALGVLLVLAGTIAAGTFLTGSGGSNAGGGSQEARETSRISRFSNGPDETAHEAEGMAISDRISVEASTEDMLRATAGFTLATDYTFTLEDGGGSDSEQEPEEIPEFDDPEKRDTYLAQSQAKGIDNLWGYTNLGIAQVDNHLNVRRAPSEEAELEGKMTKGAACEILEIEDGWAHIKSGKVEGYVSMDYLLTGDAARDRAAEVVYTKAVVNTQTLKVRDEPSTDSPVVTLVAREERLEVVNLDTPGWAKIMLDDEEAYVSTDYCIIEEELDTAVSMKELMFGSGVSQTRVNLVAYAKQFVGNPYVWGGTSLTKGADCSGFVLSVFKKFGISMPRTSREQANCGTGINLADARPGDLIFYAKGGTINHVAIYIGNGQVVHASNKKTGIKISNATYRSPARIRRVITN